MNIYSDHSLFLPLNTTLNKIHSWSSPEQNPMKRMFATRLYGIVCAVMEVSILIFKSLKTCVTSIKFLGKLPYVLGKNSSLSPSLCEIGTLASQTRGYFFGLSSTVFFGIIFSPEINFKIHLKLRLVTDQSTKKSQEEKKLQIELQKTETAKLQLEQNIEEALQAKQEEMEMQIIQSRLAELLS